MLKMLLFDGVRFRGCFSLLEMQEFEGAKLGDSLPLKLTRETRR